MLRVGMLTSGGDAQGLNAAMRGVAKVLYQKLGSEVEIYGILEGYRGLINRNYRLLKPENFSGILTEGGTMLKTSRVPFKSLTTGDEEAKQKIESMIETYKYLQLDCLVVLGGNGSHKTANLLSERGLNVITLPKTIDNDLACTDMTFGFWSAVNVATNTIDMIHTTAASHNRVFIIEIMGHKVGWIALYSGIAGGADVVLLPEINYDVDKVNDAIMDRVKSGKNFTIIAIAEGALSKKEAKLPKKEIKNLMLEKSASVRLKESLTGMGDYEIRTVIPGHMQRGGIPTAYDRVLSSRVGAYGAELIMNKEFGYMVGIKNGKITKIPLKEVAGALKTIPKDAEEIAQAKALGICFGD